MGGSGFWMGFRGHRDIVEIVILALMRKPRLRPRLLDDMQGLGKAVLALGVGDAIGLVGPRQAAAPDPEDEASPAHLVDRRGLLGDA